jgi:hypothetical protein
MFDSQTIQMQGTTATELYSPWFPRGGDYGLFTLEVTGIAGSGTPKLKVALVQKNASSPGDGTAITGVTFERTTTGRTTVDFANGAGSLTGFLELVRYKFTIQYGTSGTSWATFRMLAPVWYDKV